MEFRNEFFFLSNFYPADVVFEGIKYPSSEHAFAAAKTLDKYKRIEIARALTPDQAKSMGRRVRLRKDWEEVKLSIMETIVRNKFEQNATICVKLLNTRDLELVENNYWNDTFWGVCKGVGENNLGKILMKVRSEFRNDRNI